MHAMLRIGNSPLMLVDEFTGCGVLDPEALKGSPVTTVHLKADTVVARAVTTGAMVTKPVADLFRGDRYGKPVDPFGHHGSVAIHVRNTTPEEMHKALAQMTG